MNPVLILTYNNLELTKRCVESVREQDIETDLFIYDNGSTDGTHDWLAANRPYINPTRRTCHSINCVNSGVSFGWNTGLRFLFENEKQPHCLVIGNDTILPPWFYSELLSLDVPFVTGFAVENMHEIEAPPEWKHAEPHPDFSAFLIRRKCWEKVGPFDEEMVSWASDCDYHVRAHKLGVPLLKANIPFYHIRSSTIRLAPSQEAAEMHRQANADREVFRRKWGCAVGSREYAELFKEAPVGEIERG